MENEWLVVTIEDGGGECGGAWASVYRAASLEDAKEELVAVMKAWEPMVDDENGRTVPLWTLPGYRSPSESSIKWSDSYFAEDGMVAWWNIGESPSIRKVQIIQMPEIGERYHTS